MVIHIFPESPLIPICPAGAIGYIMNLCRAMSYVKRNPPSISNTDPVM